MEQNLPHVSQLIQIHVGEADEREGQERLTVPPHGEVRKQVALIDTGRGAQEEGNHVIKVLAVVLQNALDGVHPSEQVEASAEHREHTGDHPGQRHWLQQLCGSDAVVLGVGFVSGAAVERLQLVQRQYVRRPQLDLRLHVRQVDLGGERARVVVALLCLLDERVKLYEGVRSHSAAYSLWVICDDELPLQLVQEAEGQDVWIVGRAHHEVSHAQGTRKIDIVGS